MQGGVKMEIQCPGCMATGNVDLSRMPPGAKLKCPKCGHLFPILGDTGSVLFEQPGAEKPRTEQSRTERSRTEKPRAGKPPPLDYPTPIPESAEAFTRPQASAFKAHEPTPSGMGREINKPSFHGTGGTLFGIYIVNLILSILTLGIYHFWGKTKIRNYIYNQCELMEDRFSYHGTGWELFIGWGKAMGIILIGFFLIGFLSTLNPFLNLLYLPAFLLLIPFARVGARRYRMSRSSWHGIRFSFRGGVNEALLLYIRGILLSVVTLGIYIPVFHVKRQNFWRNYVFFGNAALRYDGKGRDLLVPFLLYFNVLIPFTLGIGWFWYRARVMRYDWERTSFEGVGFRPTFTGGGLFGLKLGNLLLFVFTLGLARPLIIVRTVKFLLDNITMEGNVELDNIRQDARSAEAVGEGLMDQLDIGGGLF
jgi:predicted Zn finger-like uncharacterized protein